MFQDLTVVIAVGGHYGGSYLAQADSMAPSASMQNYFIRGHLDIKCRTLEMAL